MLNDNTKFNLIQAKWMIICIIVVGFLLATCQHSSGKDNPTLTVTISPPTAYQFYVEFDDNGLKSTILYDTNAIGVKTINLDYNVDYIVTIYDSQEKIQIHTTTMQDEYEIKTQVTRMFLPVIDK